MRIEADGTVVPDSPLEEADETIWSEDGADVPWEVAACHWYADTGNMAGTARRFNTTVGQIKKLMSCLWWQEEVARLHRDQRQRVDASLTKMLDTSIDLIMDRLENGDLDEKGRRKPMRTRDIAACADFAFNKRQILRNQPTQIAGDTQSLSLLARKLEALGAGDPTLLEAPNDQ